MIKSFVGIFLPPSPPLHEIPDILLGSRPAVPGRLWDEAAAVVLTAGLPQPHPLGLSATLPTNIQRWQYGIIIGHSKMHIIKVRLFSMNAWRGGGLSSGSLQVTDGPSLACGIAAQHRIPRRLCGTTRCSQGGLPAGHACVPASFYKLMNLWVVHPPPASYCQHHPWGENSAVSSARAGSAAQKCQLLRRGFFWVSVGAAEVLAQPHSPLCAQTHPHGL